MAKLNRFRIPLMLTAIIAATAFTTNARAQDTTPKAEGEEPKPKVEETPKEQQPKNDPSTAVVDDINARLKTIEEFLALAEAQREQKQPEAAALTLAKAKEKFEELKKLLENKTVAGALTSSAADTRTKLEARQKVLEDQLTTKTASTEVERSNATCGGAPWCLVGGAFLASYSFVFTSTPREGAPSFHLVSVVLPAVGLRKTIYDNLSLDMMLYTAVINTDLTKTQIDLDGCRSEDSGFEDRLPCEGNAVVRPYVGAMAGVTLGTENLGLVTPAAVVGLGRTAQDPNPRPYLGIMFATGGFTQTFPLGRAKVDGGSQ